MAVLDWLLDSDPAIRWQVLRDLVDAPSDVIEVERARVATEGWGAGLLALQGDDGQWAGGACFPAGSFSWREENAGQPWTATLPTLQLLRDFGIDPQADHVKSGGCGGFDSFDRAKFGHDARGERDRIFGFGRTHRILSDVIF